MEHETEKLAIYLTNLGKYNEGSLVGEWVTLPTDAEKMQAVFQRIGIGKEYEKYFITDYESSIGIQMGEYENVNELNYLANKLDDLYPYELEKYEAILAIESATTIADYINLTENMDYYDVISGVDSKSDLGQFAMDELNSEILEQMGDFASYFDFEQYGHDLDIEWAGDFVNGNYIYHNGESSYEHFTGKRADIPEEYAVTDFKLVEKKSIKAMLEEKQGAMKNEVKKESQNKGIER